MEIISSAIAAPNIALIKYWGKRDDLLKLPLNDSISITLDEKSLCSKTTILFSDKLPQDVFVINGKRKEDEKIAEAMMLIRQRLSKLGYSQANLPILIISENNFPTSAGIASSASGFCALSQAICSAFDIESGKEKSIIARLGSGSASRSVFGGYARWNSGVRADGEDSYSVQIAPKRHWADIVDIIAITDEGEKKISSKEGMERTEKTSPLKMKERLEGVKERLVIVENAVLEKNFDALAVGMMKDSDSMHALAASAIPPVVYLNEVSHKIKQKVEEINKKKIIAGYTFDAGPNAHIICQKKNEGRIKKMLMKIKGVKKLIVSGVGNGSKKVKSDKKLVQKTLRQLKIRL